MHNSLITRRISDSLEKGKSWKSFLYDGNDDNWIMRVEALIQRGVLITILALAIPQFSVLTNAHGQEVNILVSTNSVTLNMNLALRENLTTLPQINTHISLANATSTIQPLEQTFNTAIQSLVPSARVSNIDIRVKTSNSSGTWLMIENYSIVVTGANTNSGSKIATNLSFVAMNLSQPIQAGTSEINGVGPTYLLPALEAKAASNPNLVFYIDGSNPRNAVIPEQTTKTFWLLDFTWIPPVSTWTYNNDILGQSTQWTHNPLSTRYNLTLGRPSPEGGLLASYVATYGLSMSITVPSNAWADGNTISYDIPTPAETVMPAIIITSLIIALAALILDRRLTRPLRARKKR